MFFGDGSKYGLNIDYYREDEPLGTAGALACWTTSASTSS